MRNALNKMADGVKDPLTKKVTTQVVYWYYPLENCANVRLV